MTHCLSFHFLRLCLLFLVFSLQLFLCLKQATNALRNWIPLIPLHFQKNAFIEKVTNTYCKIKFQKIHNNLHANSLSWLTLVALSPTLKVNGVNDCEAPKSKKCLNMHHKSCYDSFTISLCGDEIWELQQRGKLSVNNLDYHKWHAF